MINLSWGVRACRLLPHVSLRHQCTEIDHFMKNLCIRDPSGKRLSVIENEQQSQQLRDTLSWTLDPEQPDPLHHDSKFLQYYGTLSHLLITMERFWSRVLGTHIMELAARSFIVSSMRFAPDELFDTVCQDLIGERTLNQVSQDLGMNSAIRVYTPGRFTLFQFWTILGDSYGYPRFTEGKLISPKNLSKHHLRRVRAQSLPLIIGQIAQWRGLEVAEYCARGWIVPRFHHSDEQKIYTMQWLEKYLSTRKPLVELRSLMKRLGLPQCAIRPLETLESTDRLSKQKHKIMMRYSALFRIGLFLDDFKIEEGKRHISLSPNVGTHTILSGLGPTKKLAKDAAAKNLLMLHWTWPMPSGPSPITLFYQKHLKQEKEKLHAKE